MSHTSLLPQFSDDPGPSTRQEDVRSTNPPTRNTVPTYHRHPLKQFRLPVTGYSERASGNRATALRSILQKDMAFVEPRVSLSDVSCPFPQYKCLGLAHTMFEYAQDGQTTFYTCARPGRLPCAGHHRTLLTKQEVGVWSSLPVPTYSNNTLLTTALAAYDGKFHYTDNKDGTATFNGAPADIEGSVFSAIAYAEMQIKNLHEGTGE